MLTKYATYIHIITCMNMINKSVIQQKGNEYAKNMTVCYSHIETLQTAKMRVLN